MKKFATVMAALSASFCVLSIRQFSLEGMAHSGVYLFLSFMTAGTTVLYIAAAIRLHSEED
jgi:hypothetical protein